MDLEKLKKASFQTRKDAVDQIFHAKIGNIGGVMSAVELLIFLYYEYLEIDPKNPESMNRDRFILSKGQAAPSLYSILSRKKYFPVEELKSFRQINSRLQTHPEYRKLPGIDFSSGSLGQGLSVGLGMAIAMKKMALGKRVFVMVGDGEMQEGQIWEAIMAASHFKLDNLFLIIDNNRLQDFGFTDQEMAISPIPSKLESFGWLPYECDGHNFLSIKKGFERLESSTKPKCLIANTVKGKGIDFMENSTQWHGIQNMSKKQLEQINKSLESGQ